MTNLLPPSASVLERRLAVACADLPSAADIRNLWNPATCPENILPWLAWALSVDDWDDAWQLSRKRQVVADSIQIHRLKGTVWSVKQVFRTLGLGEVDIEEGRAGLRRDGSRRRGNYPIRGGHEIGWAYYRVISHALISVQQAKQARRMLARVAPARSVLFELDFSRAALVRNGAARRDGSFTRGKI